MNKWDSKRRIVSSREARLEGNGIDDKVMDSNWSSWYGMVWLLKKEDDHRQAAGVEDIIISNKLMEQFSFSCLVWHGTW